MSSLSPRLQEIVEEFALCVGQEKLEHLLFWAQSLPPLPDWLASRREELAQVHECMTPVFVYAHWQNGRLNYYFDVPEDSPTVRGFAAILAEGTWGVTPEVVLNIRGDFYLATGLAQVLTMQRLNGLNAILAQMKRLAADKLPADPVSR